MTQVSMEILQEEAGQTLLGRGFTHVQGPIYTSRIMGETNTAAPEMKKRARTRNATITACITSTPGLTNMDTFLILNPEKSEDDYPAENGPPTEYNCVRIEFEHNPEERWWADA